MTLTLDADGRLQLPKALLDELRIEPGAALRAVVHASGDGAPTLELKPEETATLTIVDGLLVHNGRLPEGFDTVEFIREQREERARKLGGTFDHD